VESALRSVGAAARIESVDYGTVEDELDSGTDIDRNQHIDDARFIVVGVDLSVEQQPRRILGDRGVLDGGAKGDRAVDRWSRRGEVGYGPHERDRSLLSCQIHVGNDADRDRPAQTVLSRRLLCGTRSCVFVLE
jgi:hypothetical protein